MIAKHHQSEMTWWYFYTQTGRKTHEEEQNNMCNNSIGMFGAKRCVFSNSRVTGELHQRNHITQNDGNRIVSSSPVFILSEAL